MAPINDGTYLASLGLFVSRFSGAQAVKARPTEDKGPGPYMYSWQDRPSVAAINRVTSICTPFLRRYLQIPGSRTLPHEPFCNKNEKAKSHTRHGVGDDRGEQRSGSRQIRETQVRGPHPVEQMSAKAQGAPYYYLVALRTQQLSTA